MNSITLDEILNFSLLINNLDSKSIYEELHVGVYETPTLIALYLFDEVLLKGKLVDITTSNVNDSFTTEYNCLYLEPNKKVFFLGKNTDNIRHLKKMFYETNKEKFRKLYDKFFKDLIMNNNKIEKFKIVNYNEIPNLELNKRYKLSEQIKGITVKPSIELLKKEGDLRKKDDLMLIYIPVFNLLTWINMSIDRPIDYRIIPMSNYKYVHKLEEFLDEYKPLFLQR